MPIHFIQFEDSDRWSIGIWAVLPISSMMFAIVVTHCTGPLIRLLVGLRRLSNTATEIVRGSSAARNSYLHKF